MEAWIWRGYNCCCLGGRGGVGFFVLWWGEGSLSGEGNNLPRNMPQFNQLKTACKCFSCVLVLYSVITSCDCFSNNSKKKTFFKLKHY